MLAGLLLSGGGHCRTCLADRLQQDRLHRLREPPTAQTVDPSQTEDLGIRSLPQVYLSTGGFPLLLYMAPCAFAGSTQFRAICK